MYVKNYVREKFKKRKRVPEMSKGVDSKMLAVRTSVVWISFRQQDADKLSVLLYEIAKLSFIKTEIILKQPVCLFFSNRVYPLFYCFPTFTSSHIWTTSEIV